LTSFKNLYATLMTFNNKITLIRHTNFSMKLNGREIHIMKKTNESSNNEPTIAPGMNTQEELDRDATNKDLERGEVTHVTRVEVDPM